MLPKHMTALRQGVVPRAPEVMLDDAVQAHLGRLRLQPEKDTLYSMQP